MLTLTIAAAIGIAVALVAAGFALAALLAAAGRGDEPQQIATLEAELASAQRRAMAVEWELQSERRRNAPLVDAIMYPHGKWK